MPVDTKKVVERREVRFESYEDLLADAERLARGEVRTTGNWSLGQIFHHLAKTMDSSIDGTVMRIPWLMRTAVKLFVKNKMLDGKLPAGIKIPQKGEAQLAPDSDISVEDGLAALRTAVQRLANDSTRSSHPAFGSLSREEWDKLHLRHAELHLSFAFPA